jgi:hypothetical protein
MIYYKYLDLINNSILHSTKPEKDTIEYMMVQCHKTEWVKQAIEINPFHTNQFIWIDFGIYHIFHNDYDLFKISLYHLNHSYYMNNKVRIACGILSDYYFTKKVNIVPDILWCFLGGIFGGESSVLLKFADIMKNQCIHLIENNQLLLWEVNIWYSIYFEYPELFDTYIADHDYSMILNY